MKSSAPRRPRLRAFTLVETLLAIAIIGMLLGIFMTLFAPVKSMLTAALAREQAGRIITVLRSEMETLRPDERAGSSATKSTPKQYITPFDKSFYWMLNSKKPSSSIAIFTYRADISKRPRKDGSYPPVPRNATIDPARVERITMAAPLDDPLHRNSIRQAEGPVFLVRMSELEARADGQFKIATKPGVISKGSNPNSYVSGEDETPWGAQVVYRADFYRLFPTDPARYKTKSWSDFSQPVFSTNLSFRR